MKNRLIFFLSFLGFLICVYLSYEYLSSSPINCPISGAGCDAVRLSLYASFFGLSTPLYGVAFYLSMMLSVFLTSANIFPSILKRLQQVAILMAVTFGVYLTYLEAFVIQAYCIWCLGSFVISLILLSLTFKDEQRN